MERDQIHLVSALFKGMDGDARQYGSSMAAHMPTLYLLARRLSAVGKVIELGVGRGWSTVALMAALSAEKQKLSSFDIDPGRYAAVLQASGLPMEALKRYWDFQVCDSVEAARDIQDGLVGLLFVDTTHTYEKTKQELEAWLPKIHPSGVICGHDYYLYQHPAWANVSGVHKAVDEFAVRHKARFRLQLIPNDFGLFILWPESSA